MHVRNLYKTLAFYCCAILAAAIALEFIPVQEINDKSSPGFSAQRVADDLRVISKEPHSIQHPKERKVLRDFLFHRLQQMGGKAQVFEYYTIPSKIGGKFSYSNVYAEFASPLPDSSSYILLVAHYDSRFRQKVGKDTVFSFDAADDGYGLGVILELVGLALDYRDEWKQGIKVLFTDAEEHNLDGMRSAWQENREIFNGVNLMVNIDARGVKGPALLFETSPGNEKVLDLYSYAKRPQGFSLTTFVYKLLPNNTDFSIVKDTIPGMNFAVVDNLKYYHTDLDNYSNISLKSVQHYGDQLEPVMYEYLTGEEYGVSNAFVGEKDVVFFGLPLLGLFVFSKTGYLILNIAVFALFAFVLYMYTRYKMIPVQGILRAFLHVLAFAAVSVGLGILGAFILAKYNGFKFDMLNLKYIPYDNQILLTVLLVQFVWLLVFIRL
ncbi:MAG: M28 family peptidase [Bacteroidales bacterium]|nr:M28 family peptidase [Bacteroidales bacterium]